MNTKTKPISLAITALLALSFLALIPIAVSPVHAITAPTVTPLEGEYLVGQTVTLTVSWGAGVGPYDLYIVAMPAPSCIGAAADIGSAIVTVTGATSPQSVPITSITASDTNLCAVVVDTGAADATATSGVTSYTVATPITSYVNNDENTVSIDSGQSVVLTVYPSGGAPPYAYQWSTGDACAAPIGGATSASYTATPLATGTYSVSVTDSVISTPGQIDCEVVAVTVNTAFTGTLTISCAAPCELDSQVGEPALTAVVTFSGGTGPWYSVTIYSGTDSLCTGDTTKVASLNDINGTEAILSFPAPSTPSSITYYCVTINDMSATPNPMSLGPVQINTSPALSAPTFSIAPSSADYGIPVVGGVYATVQWVGGTAPYFVVLTSGSSKSCAAPDNTPVAYTVVSGGSIYTVHLGADALAVEYITLGYTVTQSYGSTVTLNFPSPSSSTYYCAIVFDSSAPAPSQTYTPAGALFTVEGLFAINPPALSTTLTEVQTPMYEGLPVTATVTWSGGTGPYDVALFTGTVVGGVCTGPYTLVVTTPGFNPQTGVTGTSASFTFLAPNSMGAYCYYAVVTDVNGNVVGSPAIFSTLTVAPYLGTVVATISAVGIDIGQTEMITVSATWAGGSAPYTATLYSGASDTTCTTKVTSSSGLGSATVSFMFTSPKTTTYYCIGVSDSSTPASLGMSNVVQFLESPPPVVTVPAGYEIAAGSATSIMPTATSTGITPDYFQWFIGAGCAAGDAVTGALATPGTYLTGVISTTTTYSVLLTDSSTGTPALSSCASITITVNNGPMGVATVGSGAYAGLIYVTNPISPGTGAGGVTVLDSDSNSPVTTIPLTYLGCEVSPAGVVTDGTTGTVYVTGSTGPATDSAQPLFACPGTPNEGVVFAIDIATNTVTTTTDIGAGTNPQGIAVGSGLSEVYVAENGVNSVGVYSLALAPLATIAVGPGPIGVAVDQSSYNVYVTDNSGNTLSILQPVLNPPPLFVVTTVNVGFEPVGVAVNPANGDVLVANSGAGTVSVLSGTTFNTLATIKVGGMPEGIDINGNFAYVANAATNAVTVINLATNTPLASTIAVGSGPGAVAVDAPNGTVFVANSESNTLSVISLANNQVIATIVVP